MVGRHECGAEHPFCLYLDMIVDELKLYYNSLFLVDYSEDCNHEV